MENMGFNDPGYDDDHPENNATDAGYIRIRVTPADNDCGYAITGYERQYNGSIDRTNGQRIAE